MHLGICSGLAGRVRPLECLPFHVVVGPDANVIVSAVVQARDGIGQFVPVCCRVLVRRAPVAVLHLPLYDEVVYLNIEAPSVGWSHPRHFELPVALLDFEIGWGAGYRHWRPSSLLPIIFLLSFWLFTVVRPNLDGVRCAVRQLFDDL